WQRGVGGSIPSMAAYVFGVIGMFRLMRGVLSPEGEPSAAVGVAARTAAAVYGANPNLIYMQGTAMGEALYLALFIWAVVFFAEFARGDARSLVKCGLCLAAACLTRYDGWFLAVAMCTAAFAVALQAKNQIPRRSLAKFVIIAAAAPALWLAYNAIIYRNPLEFANGPYSARAIEQKSASPGSPAHPGAADLPVAFSYFVKSAELNMAQGDAQRLWVALLVLGTGAILILDRRL